MRILLSAYYCSPYHGGESAVGWNVATGLAKHHEVTVICGDLAGDSPTGKDIERFKSGQGLPPGLEIRHLQAGGVARAIHDLHALPGLWFLYYEAYRRWQLQALALARALHSEKPFDLVHHVTVVGFREPGYLWQLGIPFFWGPVSGATTVPPAYLTDFGAKERFRWSTHRLLNRIQVTRGGRPAQAALAAAKIWAVCNEDLQVIRGWGADAELMPEVACNPVAAPTVRQRSPNEVLKLCWSGLFQGRKALPLLLRALATVKPEVHLDVLGDGPEAARWKALADSLGLAGRVTWHGMLPRDKALAVMDRAHAFVHSSVKEASSTVVLEALERGIPVLCHDACGMGALVNDSCGIKVPMSEPENSVRGFAAAITKLLDDPGLIAALSKGALARAAELTWESKIQRMNAAYGAIVKK